MFLVAQMNDNYSQIVRDNLKRLYSTSSASLEQDLPGTKTADGFEFRAFGQICRIRPDGIILGEEEQKGVLGILLSLYALHVNVTPLVIEPLKAFKDFPNSMPYAGAFITHTQSILVPYVERIKNHRQSILSNLQGIDAAPIAGGDFSFLLRPFPKIALCYIFYDADDEFPASVTCLYSNNAATFLPIDGLADVGEYTSKLILDLLLV